MKRGAKMQKRIWERMFAHDSRDRTETRIGRATFPCGGIYIAHVHIRTRVRGVDSSPRDVAASFLSSFGVLARLHARHWESGRSTSLADRLFSEGRGRTTFEEIPGRFVSIESASTQIVRIVSALRGEGVPVVNGLPTLITVPALEDDQGKQREEEVPS